MGELGERLRAAREELDRSLEQVAEATKIPLSYLQALEDETLETFSSDLHARGFLRNYASFLKLDEVEVLGLYDELPHHKPRPKQSAVVPVAAKASRRSTRLTDALLVAVLVAVLGLASYSIYLRQNPVEVVATAGPPPTPTATPMPVYEGTAYEMDVELDYAAHTLQVRQRIDYTNVTSETLPDLMLNVHPNHSKNTFELNDIWVEMDGESDQPEVFLLDVTLRLDLPRPLAPNDHLAVFMDYTLNLPKISPNQEFNEGSFGYSNRSVSLGNWHPVMAPYRDDKGWYGLKSFPVGDPYVTEVADYSVTITASEGVVIAGTGLETREGTRWHFEAEDARSFAFAASDKYEVETAQVGDVRVHSYSFPDSSEAGQAALQTAAQAIELFSELYGPYPFADYRLAETEFAGGMEFTGITFLGSTFYEQWDGTARTELIPLTAHEVAHQWFYGLVGNDQLTEPWLDEAPAQYSSLLYYEKYLPDDVDWWWLNEVDQWAPTGKVDYLIYVFRDNREYFDAVYRRGAQFLHDLRQTMGDPAFLGFLAEYQRRHAYQLVSSADFFDVLVEFTTADLLPLQEEYFRQRIVP
jgi:hypothetical protein